MVWHLYKQEFKRVSFIKINVLAKKVRRTQWWSIAVSVGVTDYSSAIPGLFTHTLKSFLVFFSFENWLFCGHLKHGFEIEYTWAFLVTFLYFQLIKFGRYTWLMRWSVGLAVGWSVGESLNVSNSFHSFQVIKSVFLKVCLISCDTVQITGILTTMSKSS